MYGVIGYILCSRYHHSNASYLTRFSISDLYAVLSRCDMNYEVADVDCFIFQQIISNVLRSTWRMINIFVQHASIGWRVRHEIYAMDVRIQGATNGYEGARLVSRSLGHR